MMRILTYALLTLAFLTSERAYATEKSFQKLDPIPLWPGQEINKVDIEKTIQTVGIFQKVTQPAIITYLPKKEIANGTSLLICPGGGYGALAWQHHVERLAPFFTSRGIAVIGLMYRVHHPENKIPEDPLKDFNQAIKLIRKNAQAWNLNSNNIVGLGFSAGANLLLQYASSPTGEKINYFNFLCLWPFFRKAETYSIEKKDLDVILFTAEEDKVAPSSFSVDIAKQFKQAGCKAKLVKHKKGTHMAYNFEANGPRVDWTIDFLKWLSSKGLLKN